MRVAALATVALCVLVTGCSGETSGTPLPEQSGQVESSTGRPLPYAGAPEVTNPLPASVMERDPCTLLTSEQIDGLFAGQPDEKFRDTGIANACSWADTSRGSLVNVQLLYAARHGLSQFYVNKDSNELWLPLEPVQGYPLVAYGGVDSRETTWSCSVIVGIADNMVFQASANLSYANEGKVDPCVAARRVADLVVTTLKQGV